jgi:hypothetical protein
MDHDTKVRLNLSWTSRSKGCSDADIAIATGVYASQAHSTAKDSLGGGKVRLGIRRQLDGQRGAIRGAKK